MATYESRRYSLPIQADTIADKSISNAEFQRLNNVSSNIQTQLDSKLSSAGAFTVQTGMILPWSAPLANIPTGYLGCTGANVSRSTYSALFALIGVVYGSGDGASTFGLPNFQNRMAIGKSGTYGLGTTGGSTTESFTPAGSVSVTVNSHTLTQQQIPSHQHFSSNSGNGFPNMVQNNGALTMTSKSNGGAGNNDYILYGVSAQANQSPTSLTGGSAGHSHGGSGSFSGSAATLDVLNPYISINFIIKT